MKHTNSPAENTILLHEINFSLAKYDCSSARLFLSVKKSLVKQHGHLLARCDFWTMVKFLKRNKHLEEKIKQKKQNRSDQQKLKIGH